MQVKEKHMRAQTPSFTQCMQLLQSFQMIEMLKKSFINIEDNNWWEKNLLPLIQPESLKKMQNKTHCHRSVYWILDFFWIKNQIQVPTNKLAGYFNHLWTMPTHFDHSKKMIEILNSSCLCVRPSVRSFVRPQKISTMKPSPGLKFYQQSRYAKKGMCEQNGAEWDHSLEIGENTTIQGAKRPRNKFF
jgi:hypothetical protein